MDNMSRSSQEMYYHVRTLFCGSLHSVIIVKDQKLPTFINKLFRGKPIVCAFSSLKLGVLAQTELYNQAILM